MSKEIPVPKKVLDDLVREFLKKEDISSVDMIKYLAKSLGYYIEKYQINIRKDFNDEFNRSETTTASLAKSLLMMLFIQDKILEK